MQIPQMIKAIQQSLGVHVDGHAGPQTWAAIYQALVKQDSAEKIQLPSFAKVDERSELHIAHLLPPVQDLARALVHMAAAQAIHIKIISGLRSYAEQDQLYAQGRSLPGAIVTRAKGGYSNHNFGIAFDIGVFAGSKYLPDSPKYKAVGVLGASLGLQWGGNWTSIVDQAHFQLRPPWAAAMTEKTMLAELRLRVRNNTPIYG